MCSRLWVYLAILSSRVSPGTAPTDRFVEPDVVRSTDGLSMLPSVPSCSELLRALSPIVIGWSELLLLLSPIAIGWSELLLALSPTMIVGIVGGAKLSVSSRKLLLRPPDRFGWLQHKNNRKIYCSKNCNNLYILLSHKKVCLVNQIQWTNDLSARIPTRQLIWIVPEKYITWIYKSMNQWYIVGGGRGGGAVWVG